MFRLGKTLLFKNVPEQVLVSSMQTTTFKKQVASRLRETLFFFENCVLVYAKHYFFASSRMGLSRQAPLASWQEAPRRPGPVTGQSSHFFCTPSAAKSHQNSDSKFWPGPLGSLNIRPRHASTSAFGFLHRPFQPRYGTRSGSLAARMVASSNLYGNGSRPK